MRPFPSFLPFFNHPTFSINTNTLRLSLLSYPSNLFLFPVRLPVACQRLLCFLLCCGSCSFISLSALSGACCPETAGIRDVVINGAVKAPLQRAHPLVRSPPCLQTTLPVQLFICQKRNGPAYHYQSAEVWNWKWGDFWMRQPTLLGYLRLIHCLFLSFHLYSLHPICSHSLPFLALQSPSELDFQRPSYIPFFIYEMAPESLHCFYLPGCWAYNQPEVQICICSNMDI